jgi:hypothetical protein
MEDDVVVTLGCVKTSSGLIAFIVIVDEGEVSASSIS